MSSVYTRIRIGEVEGRDILYQDDKCFIIPSKNPHTEGHSLIIPIEEISRFEDLSPEVFSHMAVIIQKFGKVLEHIYHPERVGVAIDGFQISHTHVHIMPIWENNGGVWKGGPNPEISVDELNSVTNKIKVAMPYYFK